MGALTELRDGLQSLLESRGVTCPDGRPLYAYRFARSEFDRIGNLLRRHGVAALQNSHGAALVVSHTAEWFRRERTGGHWDWGRPLRAIGLEYGSDAQVRYRDIEDLVSKGLCYWRRPQPMGSERILAIVREAGFPVASVRDDPRISTWLKQAVLSAEKGFSVRDAVLMESYRVSSRLALALVEPAIELCTKIVELRRYIAVGEQRVDPVDYLNQIKPDWKKELPFDVEYEDVRLMIEQIIRSHDKPASVLGISRYLVREGSEWEARASIELSGHIDLDHFPSTVKEAVQQDRRLRIFPLPPLCEEPIAIAAIESFDDPKGNRTYELRGLVSKFDVSFPFERNARLLIQSGSAAIVEFVPPGGEAILSPVVALKIQSVDESSVPKVLSMVGLSSCRTTQSHLVLGIRDEEIHRISFSNGYVEIGISPDSEYRLVQFSGTASYRTEDVCYTWRTSTENNDDVRPILVGDLVRNVKEAVFQGLPKIFIDREGRLTQPTRREIFWRPRARGKWRSIDLDRPWGDVELAVIRDGEVSVTANIAVAPPNFRMTLDRNCRELRISGVETRVIAARSNGPLSVRQLGDIAVIQLGRAGTTPNVLLSCRWDAELTLTFCDPTYELRLIGNDGSLLPAHSQLSIGALRGARLLATRETHLWMELRAKDAPKVTVTRNVFNEVPLVAFTSVIAQLLGDSESLDALVRITPLGASDHIADVLWYDEDVDPFFPLRENAFSSLANTHGLELKVLSLMDPNAGVVQIGGPKSQDRMRTEITKNLPRGPWLIFGRRRNGPTIRPKILPAPTRNLCDDVTALERAIGTDETRARISAFKTTYANPQHVSQHDRAIITGLLRVARQESLPASSIDALKALARAPALATALLADCESLEEITTLTELQRDLPFLWCATTIEQWLDSFSSRAERIKALLTEVGLDSRLVYPRVVVALGNIVSLRPELAGHAKAVFLRQVAQHLASGTGAIDGASVQPLKVRPSDGIRNEIGRLIGRHSDLDSPPQRLLSSVHRLNKQSIWLPYEDRFSDVIAAPFIVADHACGILTLSDEELRRCRDAWLYDPDYFEAIVPIAVDQIVCNQAKINEIKE